MSEERSAKLKLKRKKCVTTVQGGQEMDGRVQPSSACSLRQDFTGSWFDEMELTAAEQTWKQVVSSVYPDLRTVGWGAVPSLPDFSLKMNRKEKEMINTEVFRVGDVNFEWIPLPSALTIDDAQKPCVPEIEASRRHIELIKKPSSDALPQNVQQTKSTVLPTNQDEFSVCSEDSKRNNQELPTPQNNSTTNVMLPLISQKSTKEIVTKSQTLLKSHSKNVGESEMPRKASTKSVKKPQTSQKTSARHGKEQQSLQKPSINLWATVTSRKSNKIIQNDKVTKEPETERKPQPSDVIMVDAEEETSEGSSRGHTIKETAEKLTDATNSLDTCPICLMQFPKQFSQLDMDSHLAQCLSETTVDVVW